MSLGRLLTAGLGVALATMVAWTGGSAQPKFPSRPITLINSFTPGGPADIHFRVLAAQMEKVLGVPIVIENKPGANGTLGPATMAASAKPDGHTISYIGTAVVMLPLLQKTAFDPMKDFTYIIGLSRYNYVLVVHKDSPWKTWEDLVADARANPGKISYGTFGTNGTHHLAMEHIERQIGVKFTHVPMRGASEQVAGIMGNHIQFAITGGLGYQMVEQGQFRALQSWTTGRNVRFPDLPTLADAGLKLEIDVTTPYGIAGPKGMSPQVVQTLHDAMKKASESPENLEVLKKLDQDNFYMNSADFRAFLIDQGKIFQHSLEEMGVIKK